MCNSFIYNVKKKKHKRDDLYILYKINHLLIERSLLKPSERILIAVSGGQDSICLLNILHRLSYNWGWNLGIVYCDHQWCCDSFLQAKEVSRLAVKMKIHFYQAISTYQINTETSARKWRYELMRRIAIYHDYTAIVTGHTASDRIETLLYNLFRGTGINGFQSINWKRKINTIFSINILNKNKSFSYCKTVYFQQNYSEIEYIKPVNCYLVRPVLYLTRTETSQIIKEWNLPISLDSSNTNLNIKKNRIRYQLLPYIRKHFNAKIDSVLNNWIEIVNAESLYVEAIIQHLSLQIEKTHNKDKTCIKYVQLNVTILRALPIFMQRRILKHFLDVYTKSSVNFEHVESIRLGYSIQKNTYKTQNKNTYNIFSFNKYFHLPGKTTLYLIDDYLFLLA